MQEKQTLADAPQRSRAELIRPGRALIDTVRQTRTHMVEREIRVRLVSHSAHAGEDRGRRGQRWRVAQSAANFVEQVRTVLRGWSRRRGSGGCRKPHERGEI